MRNRNHWPNLQNIPVHSALGKQLRRLLFGDLIEPARSHMNNDELFEGVHRDVRATDDPNDWVRHRRTNAMVFGQVLGEGEILKEDDVYESSSGRWERCTCPGVALGTRTEAHPLWVRPVDA